MGRRAFFGGRCFFFDRFDSTGAKAFPRHAGGVPGARVWYAAFWCGRGYWRAVLSFTAAPSAGAKGAGSERKQPPAVHKEGPREHAKHAEPGSAPKRSPALPRSCP